MRACMRVCCLMTILKDVLDEERDVEDGGDGDGGS